jgi:hypothetical protein
MVSTEGKVGGGLVVVALIVGAFLLGMSTDEFVCHVGVFLERYSTCIHASMMSRDCRCVCVCGVCVCVCVVFCMCVY